MEAISEESVKQEQIKKSGKKRKADIEYEDQCRQKWARLAKNFVCNLDVPIHLLSLPTKATTLRGLQAHIVENETGPRMWESGVNYQDKSNIVCIFEVRFSD